MQEKKLAFSFFSFAESGLFKGLRRIQIEKSFSPPTRVLGCERNHLKRIPALHFPLPDPPAAPEFGGSEHI
jgi:hypothetical protein